jgi:hypothetical protein
VPNLDQVQCFGGENPRFPAQSSSAVFQSQSPVISGPFKSPSLALPGPHGCDGGEHAATHGSAVVGGAASVVRGAAVVEVVFGGEPSVLVRVCR